MSLIGRFGVVRKISDGLGNIENDKKYTGKAKNQLVKIVAIDPKIPEFYITDFFIPEFIDLNNDYIHYGFLKVSKENLSLLEDD